ncbi:CHASE2 domain-containing protein [Desulfonema magnum]|uniref:Adenylate/guanylate cyclase domain-containing protein, CHASE2 domain-containing n=1 Tax=Desulfonema magnum TaxID=45655 RepID=A0A975BSL0_9BACT|nr:adenylate/guanylate cyclase domain-containing protein [Desulfonema magnum]QTA90677.1 Adenylate/guanylate cyclase domain-containing protein, CHASE2 domain-containing [Desulfonema magnum]
MKKYNKFIKKHITFLISLVAILVGVFAYTIGIPFLDFMELKTIDLRFASRGAISPLSDVVLAVVDEKSIAEEGKWMWPRSKLASLVTKLSEAGARVIAFDIGFLEPDINSKKLIEIIEELKKKLPYSDVQAREIETYLENLKLRASNDRLLADAIKNSKAKIVLGYFFHTEAEKPAHITEEELSDHEKNIRGSLYKLVCGPRGVEISDMIIKQGAAPQSNIRMISDSADYSGFFNMFPDKDGVVRWIPAVMKFENKLYAPLSLIIASAYLDMPLSVKIAHYGIRAVHIGDRPVVTDEFGRILINYRGKEKSFPHISITDILSGKVPDKDLKDKIVIVGVTAIGTHDMRVTPFENVFPGTEIHANVVDTILSGNFLHQPVWAAVFDLMAIIIAGIVLGIVLPRTEVVSGAAVTFSLFMGYIFLCQYFFSHRGVILNLVYPLCVIIFLYISITIYKYLTESAQKKFIKNAFSTYLAPSVVEELIQSPEKLGLGGEERVITAFFSDVQGFTSISEKLSPKELVELLNEFLTEMTNIILHHKGTVDKFEGDAIIAFFGAPNELDNQAKAACKACADMQNRLVQLRKSWKETGRPELHMRVGLFTGPAVVGNMGSKKRMDYTMMGDTVNTAARLEGVNKVYGIYNLIGERTREEAGDSMMTREIDLINVVGKKEPIKIYQLMGYAEDADDLMKETVINYTRGLKAYRNQEWDNARDFFKKVLDLTSDQDKPAKVMLARCEELKANPPGAYWNGAFTMKTK